MPSGNASKYYIVIKPTIVKRCNRRACMLPTPEEFSNLFDRMLTNRPQGSPRKVNMYKTRGYFADMPLIPLRIPERPIKLFSKTLIVDACVKSSLRQPG